MITTTTKNEIFNRLQFFYTNPNFNIYGLQNTTFASDYKDADEFEQALFKENTRKFFRTIIANYPNEKRNILTNIKNEYCLFCRNKTKAENENWLNHTYNFIVNINDLSRFIGKSDTVAFLDWYDTMIIKQPEQSDTKEYKLEKNQNITIFKNDLGQTLFNQLHNIYKNQNNDLANYSFLFYVLKDYLVCSGTNFKNHLSTLNIFIDKIDTRQSGKNSKTDLFKAIESKYIAIAQ